MSIAIFSSDPAKLESARAWIESKRLSPECAVTAVRMDVADHEDVEAKIPWAVREFGVPDILIKSAGIGHHVVPHIKNKDFKELFLFV